MHKVGTVEEKMEQDRNLAGEEMNELRAESDALQAEINALDKKLDIQEREHKAIRRGWERKIEFEEDNINLCKHAQEKTLQEMQKMEDKKHEIKAERQKNPEVVRLTTELKRIEKE